jgi:hypothetical protein
MFVRLVTRLALMVSLAVLVASCGGGSPAPAATGLKAAPGESSASISWDMVPGVEYWLFYAPTSLAPADNSNMSRWFSGGVAILKVSSPFTVSGLANGVAYSFTVNGRTDGGPGGPAPTAATTTPRLAGATWAAGTTTSSADLHAVTYGTQYVAGGVGGVLFSSTDGTAWTALSSPTTQTINGANYYSDYRMVGNVGLMLSSTDAITWTPQTTNTTQNLYAFANNGLGRMVTVGANGTIFTSTDGSTWAAAPSVGTNQDLYAVTYSTYNSGTWLAVGAQGTMVSSVDGLNWTAVSTGTTADLRGVAYGYTNTTTLTTSFVVVGAGGTLLTSTDATAWTSQILPGAAALNAVRYSGQFVVVGNKGTAFLSTDASTWTAADTSGTTQDLWAVGRGTNTYMAVGTAGTNLLAK